MKAGPGPDVVEAEELERVVPAVEALIARIEAVTPEDLLRLSRDDSALIAAVTR